MEIDCNPHQDIDAKIRALLHDTFHLTALYPYQELVIRTVLERDGLYGKEIQIEAPDHQLVVLPTGSGKSICFMLPSLLLEGITLVVYPLLRPSAQDGGYGFRNDIAQRQSKRCRTGYQLGKPVETGCQSN